MRQVMWLLAGGMGIWLVLALPAGLLARDPAQGQAILVYAAVALGICLVPTALTLLWTVWGFRQQPQDQWMAVMGGTGLRMVVTLGAGVALYMGVPYFSQYGYFWVCILISYLTTLALETVLVLRLVSAEARPLPGQNGG